MVSRVMRCSAHESESPFYQTKTHVRPSKVASALQGTLPELVVQAHAQRGPPALQG